MAADEAIHEEIIRALSTSGREKLSGNFGAAVSSFCFFASGALIPILPYIFGMSGGATTLISMLLVGFALMVTGGVVGLMGPTM